MTPPKPLTPFWEIFGILNAAAIVIYLGILIWAAFDLRNRVDTLMIAQIPPIAMMVLRRIFR